MGVGGGRMCRIGRRRSVWGGGGKMSRRWEEEGRFGGRGGGADVYDRKRTSEKDDIRR